MYVGYWFDETVTALPGTIKNIYHHFWWHTDNHNFTVAYGKSDAGFYRTENWGQSYVTSTSKAHSNITYNSKTYSLESRLMRITSPQAYTDNDIYEFFVEYYTSATTNPYVINNRSILSYVIFNIPDNTTLQGMDSDSDGLTDYQELFVTYTNPFLPDTDNDGFTDRNEYLTGSDPNNYLSLSPLTPLLSAASPQNQSIGQPLNPTLSITITQSQNHLMNVTFLTNTSGSWQPIGSNTSVPNGRYSQTPLTMNTYNTTYYWAVHCTDGLTWTNKTYQFKTWPGPRGWIYYQKITVNHSLVNQSLKNFPILISLTDPTFTLHLQPNAQDVQFWDATNTTRYHHEIEKYNYSTGQLIAWVNITYLRATQDTIIWMRYGNTTCGPQQNIAGTWDGNYLMIQHMNETGNTLSDSTTYNNNGQNTGTDPTTAGKADGARQYNDNDRIVVNNFTHSPNALTVEAWIYRDNTDIIYIFCKGTFSTSSDWILYLRNNQGANVGIDFGINNHIKYFRTGDTPVNSWFYVTATYNSGTARIYLNGTHLSYRTGWPAINASYPHLGLGNDYVGTNGGSYPMTQVRLDELRVSKVARNSSWIITSYNTMSKPTSFIHSGAEQQTLFTLTTTKNGTGSGTIEYHPSGPYPFGTKVTLWANATTGSTFTGWSGALTGLTTPQTLYMNGNKAVNAQFTIHTYTITATAETGGSITPSGAIQINYGGYKNFTITPTTGYHITDVLVDGGSIGAASWYNFTNVITNHSISASFAINQYKISASAGTHGTITPNGDVTVTYGSYQNFTITPDVGNHVQTVLVDSGSIGAVTWYNFTNIQANHTISASFTINTYTITASASAGGTITPNGDITVDYGAYQNFSVAADTGYHIADVVVDSVSQGARSWYNFTNVQADHTISASFALNNQAPTQGTPLLVSAFGTNTTDENLICTNQSTVDPENDPVFNTYHWMKNSVSLTTLLFSCNTANSTHVKDYSSYHNNGTIHGATWTSSGKIGGAYNFNGVDNYLQVPDASSLDGDGTWSELTIDYWLYLNSDQLSKTIIAKYGGTGANQRSYLMYISGTTSNKLFGAVARTGDAYIYQEIATVPTKQQWYHVAMVYKSGDGLRVYLNGQLEGTKTPYSGNIQESPGKDLYIGCRYGNSAWLDGMIDEVEIYPYALTPQQISQKYNDTKNGYSNRSTIVKEHTSIGDLWQCQVTPSDSHQDGITKSSNAITIVPIYTLTVTQTGTGSGTIDVHPTGPYYTGTIVTLWANASTGSTFTGWSGALSGATSPETLTMNSNKTVNAEFTRNGPYTLTTTKSGTGSGTVEVNTSGPYYYGAKVTLWANASISSTFMGWSGNLTGTETPQTLTITSNAEVDAAFTLKGPYALTLTKSGTGQGTIQANATGPFYYGMLVRIWANASSGSTFTGFTGSLTGTTTPQDLSFDGDETVDAAFTLNASNIPNPPTGFTATTFNSTQIDLTWTNGAKADTTYIERRDVDTLNLFPYGFQTAGTGTAGWTTTTVHTGTGAIKLTTITTGDYAAVSANYSTSLSTINTISFWYNHTAYANYAGPRVSLGVDNDSNGNIDHLVVSADVGYANEWTQKNLPTDDDNWWYGTYNPGTGEYTQEGGPVTLTWIKSHYPTAEIHYLTFYMGVVGYVGAGSVYLDDIIINGVDAIWERGTGTLLYNNSGNTYEDTGRSPATTYYYHAWSWNATDHLFSLTTAAANATTRSRPYTLTINTNGTGEGTVQRNKTGPYYLGDSVTLWANASTGSTFTGWYGNLSGTASPEILLINGNKTVTAQFTSTGLLSINSSFDSASINTYTIEGTNINFTLRSEHLINSGADYEYWTNFKVHNTLNKNVTFRITNANLVPFLSTTGHEVQLVYSYDGVTWYRFTNHTYTGNTYTFWQNFTANQVQIATFYPFNYTQMQTYLETVNTSQYAVKTVLGKSTQNRDIDLLTITNPIVANNTKKIIYIIGRQHAAETASSHMLKGLIDFLLSSNSVAQRLRDTFIWYIVPMVNPDGVYLGCSRANGTIQSIDINREWDSATSNEINVVKNHLTSIKNTVGVNLFIDWHNQMDEVGWYNYIYAPPNTNSFYTQGQNFYTNLSRLTDFDTCTTPGFGSNSARGYAGSTLGVFSFTFEPCPHLATWTLDSLHQQGKNFGYTINDYYPAPPLLNDSEFTASSDSNDLIANATTQDWYESRNDQPTLISLDTNDVANNTGKKARFADGHAKFAYLSQEFRYPQNGRFNISLDMYIEFISVYYNETRNLNRTGFIFVGNNGDGANGPCSTGSERFVYLTFYDRTPGDTGDDMELRAYETNTPSFYRTNEWTLVAANLSYNTWYTITLDVNFTNHTYDVYINHHFTKRINGFSGYTGSSLSYISFYGSGTARGEFSLDNIFAPAATRHRIRLTTTGNGSLSTTPGESTYTHGSTLQITAFAEPGWSFDHWTGDLSGNTNPKTITITTDINATAVFTQNEYTITTHTTGTGTITLTPSQPTYHYNTPVTIQATPQSGWQFTHWTGNLAGHINPTSLYITNNIDLTAYFSNTAIYTLTTNVIGSGVVNKNPDRAIYEPSATVTLTPVGNSSGWTFNNWTGNVPTGHEHDNPLTLTIDANKIITARFKSSEPTVLTKPVSNLTSTSVTLQGYINNTGGENCSTWFEYDLNDVEECMGAIATGTVCKDGRSILLKNRHYYYDNVKPYFYQGTNYSFFGIGDYGTSGYCRMGQNQVGLAINNMDVSGTITHWKYQTDWSSGSQDHDSRFCLGNYSTVRDAAYYLARHGYYYGNGSTNGQYLIISSEPGVGAIVAIDRVGHTNITWINNTYAGCANSWYCDKKWDTGDYNDRRAYVILRDIVQNGTSSDHDHLLNWKDIAQRVAKDVSGKEKGTGSYSYSGQIACSYSRSSVVSVAGNSSLNSSIHMSWVAIGQTTQVAIFLPLYAGNLHSTSDIPANFTTANNGKGIQPYADVKRNYARGDLADGYFYCSRVREILKYTSYNENLSFNAFDNLMDTIMLSADQQEARYRLDSFMETMLPKELRGYIANSTKSSTDTFKHYPQGIGSFTQTVTNLKPGTMYYVKAWANNTGSSSNGSILRFMTKPDTPSSVQLIRYESNQVNLSWTKGSGAFYTVVERNATGVSTWNRGEGILVYNGTAKHCINTGLTSGVQYYYRLWSYTAEKGLQQYSTNSVLVYTGTNMPPAFSNINPADGATGILTNITQLSLTIQDPEGNPFSWTIQTSPNIGSTSGSGGNGTKTCTISGLTYGTTYTWFVNATDGTSWNKKTYTFTTKVGILLDPDFNASVDSADLRANTTGQDWYESRHYFSGGNASLLTLNTSTIGGNIGKKAALKNYNISSNAYLTQDLATQTNNFYLSFDIYIDRIQDSANYDRAGHIYIGNDLNPTATCPTGTSNERFVYMVFYDPTVNNTTNHDLILKAKTATGAASATTSTWTTVTSGLSYHTWYNIKILINFISNNYNVYVNGTYVGTVVKNPDYTSTSINYISFASDSSGKGDFYVDNVIAVPYINTASPAITNEQPPNTSTDVSISTSQLSVTITDTDNDLLDYTIQTKPYIGNTSGYHVIGGTKTCNIIGLSYDTTYTWYVNVTDGHNWTRKVYTFTTETAPVNNPPAVTDPTPTNESTGVIISTASLSITITDSEFDSFDWSITTTPNIGSNSGTGASNGIKTCAISGLTYATSYTWYVKTTDRHGWTNKSFTFTTESAPVNDPPLFSGPIPANNSVDISRNITLINITIQDPEGDDIDWTIQTSPNIGSNSGTDEGNGSKTCSLSGLNNYTTYKWFVNATEGTSWTRKTYVFTTKGLLADPTFNASTDSLILRNDTIGIQDWYESRGDATTFVTLNTDNIGGNSGKKAAMICANASSGTAYLSQEFSSYQTGTFNVSLDIYIDQIYDYAANDRTAHIFIGNNTGGNSGTSGPCSTAIERFVCLAFYDSTPGSGNDIILKARQYSNQSFTNTAQWTNITTGLSYDTWYTIRLEINVLAGTYNVYVNGVLQGNNIHKQAEYTSTYVSYMTFYVGGYSRGDFFIDNIYAPARN